MDIYGIIEKETKFRKKMVVVYVESWDEQLAVNRETQKSKEAWKILTVCL